MQFPNIDPVAFHVGWLQVHWYGLMYLFGFAAAWLLAAYRAQRSALYLSTEEVSDLIFYAAIGVIVGGRIGYMLFYNWTTFIHMPWQLFKVWEGGMSFHGGLIGVLVALCVFAKWKRRHLWDVIDFVTPLVPFGLGLGRLGNFINGELWGRVTTVSWGMIFPRAGDLPRHPSQLYEFMLEGVILFTVVWWYSAKRRPRAATFGLFLLLYGLFRFVVEFFRAPDFQLGFVAWGWMTRGQELSLPMLVAGAVVLFMAYRRNKSHG